ncbi:hypothetical protein OEZ86_010186 [Tetradesmus obliquus]|nr:hypothetical protein OEZ86_010186 [Tetradesmus obliquus]
MIQRNRCGKFHLSLALLAASMILYTITSFAGTERRIVSFLHHTPLAAQPVQPLGARVLADGLLNGAEAKAAATNGETKKHLADGSSRDAAAGSTAAAAAAAAMITNTNNEQQVPSSGSHGQKLSGRMHAPTASHQQQQHQQPTSQNRTSQPLPWRALHHLNKTSHQDQANTSSSQAPAYLVSAFLDTRPIMHSQRAKIAVIMALNMRIEYSGWKCLLRLDSSTASSQVLDLALAHTSYNNEFHFMYQASTGFCELPQALQDTLLPNSSLGATRTQPKATLTLIKASDARSFKDASWIHRPHIWVPVEVIPVLTPQQYLSGEGSIAVCTPPVHTDGYAATLLGWQAFHKVMGVQQVFMYSFNPGPLIKPLMEFYAAQGFAQIQEWIVPFSSLNNKQQECLLPFFHASEARSQFDSPPCTYHQDNYALAHWGQGLAIQDCVYRAMAASHRWVAVLDLDEYILPQAAQDWHTMMQQLVSSSKGVAAAEYSFDGVMMCSGCLAQQQQQQQPANTTSSPTCQLRRTVGFHHITWPSTVLPASGMSLDAPKVIVDPLAVGQVSAHLIDELSPHSLSTGSVTVQRQVAVKMHDRVHDIHLGNTTFAARMLPLLKNNIGQVAAATAAGRFHQQALPLWPSHGSACEVCGSVSMKQMKWPPLNEDPTLCSRFGQRLQQQVRMDVSAMVRIGLFTEPTAWGSTDPAIANLYGGHSFDAWAPPKQ